MEGFLFPTIMEGFLFPTIMEGFLFPTIMEGFLFPTIIEGFLFPTIMEGFLFPFHKHSLSCIQCIHNSLHAVSFVNRLSTTPDPQVKEPFTD